MPTPGLYAELADWWPLMSPPSDYDAEAADLLSRIGHVPTTPLPTLLELGSGGGSVAFHLERHFRLTLTEPETLFASTSHGVTESRR